jgi:hypothetical protein
LTYPPSWCLEMAPSPSFGRTGDSTGSLWRT